MSQIVQCDFCGNITNEPAAQVVIRLNSRVESNRLLIDSVDRTSLNGGGVGGFELYKDSCKECIKKFIVSKPTVFAITTASGMPVDDKDL